MIAFVILAHNDSNSLLDLVKNISFFCPESTVFLYNSGKDQTLGKGTGLELIPDRYIQQLEYAHIMPFFLDIFNWFINDHRPFDYLINLETDMLFFRNGYESFIMNEMKGFDYMAPLFKPNISHKSKWRPYNSLRGELKKWTRLLNINDVNGAFSPAQVFSRNYIEKLLNDPNYSKICELVKHNKSFTLQEILNPTLVDYLDLQGKSYPEGMESIIRYRPYQAISGIKKALDNENAFFVHPVRREQNDPARRYIFSMMNQ